MMPIPAEILPYPSDNDNVNFTNYLEGFEYLLAIEATEQACFDFVFMCTLVK